MPIISSVTLYWGLVLINVLITVFTLWKLSFLLQCHATVYKVLPMEYKSIRNPDLRLKNWYFSLLVFLTSGAIYTSVPLSVIFYSENSSSRTADTLKSITFSVSSVIIKLVGFISKWTMPQTWFNRQIWYNNYTKIRRISSSEKSIELSLCILI